MLHQNDDSPTLPAFQHDPNKPLAETLTRLEGNSAVLSQLFSDCYRIYIGTVDQHGVFTASSVRVRPLTQAIVYSPADLP